LPAINKGRRSQLLSDFCIFLNNHFNALDVFFGEIFLLSLSTADFLRFVINFAHTRVIGL